MTGAARTSWDWLMGNIFNVGDRALFDDCSVECLVFGGHSEPDDSVDPTLLPAEPDPAVWSTLVLSA